jgi:hypothetical protein
MLQILAAHESARLYFLCTGNESWLLYSYHEWTRLTASWDDAAAIRRLFHYHKKTMLSVVFSQTGQFLIDIVPQGINMDTDDFADNITDKMARLSDP